MNGTQPECKCFIGFSGVNCELVSGQLKMIKAVSTGTAVVAILIMSTFAGIIVFLDISKLFGINAKLPTNPKNSNIKKKSKKKISPLKARKPKPTADLTKPKSEKILEPIIESLD